MRIRKLILPLILLALISSCAPKAPQKAGSILLSFDQLQEKAYMAAAVYESNRYIQNFFIRKYDQVIIHDIPEIEVKLVLLKNHEKKQQIIIIRGTSNLKNAIIDLEYYKTDDSLLNIRLHNGFQRATRQTLKELEELNILSKSYDSQIVGHSLGGAMAGILGAYLVTEEYKVSRITTFGQPKFTDEDGARILRPLPLIRVINRGDLVTMIPPWTPLTAFTGPYTHLGAEIVLDGRGKFKTHPVGDPLIMQEKKSFWETIVNDEINLEKHFISEYFYRLKELTGKKLVIEFKPGYEW